MIHSMIHCLSVAIFALGATVRAETNSEVLKKVWSVGARNSCTQEMRNQFNSKTLASLSASLSSESDIEALKTVLNPFLKSLNWSHTEFMTPSDESFFLFRSYKSSLNQQYPPAPKIINPGIQVGRDSQGFFAREVLDGFPAQKSGVLKGDRLIQWQNQPFTGTWGTQETTGPVVIERNHQLISFTTLSQSLNWNDAFLDAIKVSQKVIPIGNKRIGYVHLWTGVHQESADLLNEIVKKLSAQKIDGLILDLRGGYGGAWWEHLVPFFENDRNFFEAELTDGAGHSQKLIPDSFQNKDAFLGPMVVLINEGVRSGKEALAYQFKKSRRAKVIGTPTAGYFSAGGIFFSEQPVDYLLYLCVNQVTLDGNIIEGQGITPDIHVQFETNNPWQDSQLWKALELLSFL